MYLSGISFENFRNLENASVEFSKETNIIFGQNGAGKTNLIEAVWCMTGRRSFRGVRDLTLIRAANGERESTAAVKAAFFSGGRRQTAELSIGGKKTAKLNGVECERVGDLSECFKAVVFSPSDLELIDSSPIVRRKWLDETIGALRPKYDKVLSAYKKCLDQRSAVLKSYIDGDKTADMLLDVYDHRLAEYGEFLIKQRQLYLQAVSEIIPPLFDGLTKSRERLTLEYECSCGDGSRQEILKMLEISRKNDIKYQSTNVGAHRDDVLIKINGMDCKNFGSQGQKRSAVLALKLCEAQIIKNNTEEQPIVLLDDVLSELDEYRRDYVLNRMTGGQIFITCCEMSTVRLQGRGSAFEIDGGRIINQTEKISKES